MLKFHQKVSTIMKIINAHYTYLNGKFHKEIAIAFSDKIEAIDNLQRLQAQYPDAQLDQGGLNTVLLPGLINTHVHLEFSANKSTLRYGEFMPWLDSVIEHREDLISVCDNAMMMQACQSMLRSGITTFGAISSFGAELEVCTQTPQKVIFFNELIGSNPATADMLYRDFLERVDASKAVAEYGITPAIAIHAPYSVHPIVVKKALEVAKNEHLPLSAHFLESPAEREWLEKSQGDFLEFFQKFFSTSSAVTSIDEFLESFEGLPTHFVHAVQTQEKELKVIAKEGHSIAHCPRSNRLLGCGRLPLEKVMEYKIPFTLATDGLSSNTSLNLFDEMRAALMMHYHLPLEELANQLIESITTTPAKIFGLNSGEIRMGKSADLIRIQLPDKIQKSQSIALQTILHTQEVERVYINGEAY